MDTYKVKTDAEKKRLLLLAQWESNVSGSPESARILLAGLLERGWKVHVTVGHPGPYVAIYEDMGCEVTVIPQKHWLMTPSWHRYLRSLWARLRATLHFRRLIARLRPEVVYINTVVGPEAALAARLSGVPVVWHLRDMFADTGGDMRGLPLFGKWGARFMIRWLASHVVAVSHAVMRNVVGEMPTGKFTVVLNGVSTDFFPVTQPDPASAGDRLVIGVPGTLRPIKGQAFLLDALTKTADELGEFEVRITGEGRECYRLELEALAAVPELRGRVKFLGNVSDMPGFLRGCDIVVVPSSCDPLPRTVMESMAAGRPLIATRVGGIPEMVDDGENGLLVEYGNHREIIQSVARLVIDRGLRERLGSAAAEKACREFTVARYQDTLIAIVKKVCSRVQTI